MDLKVLEAGLAAIIKPVDENDQTEGSSYSQILGNILGFFGSHTLSSNLFGTERLPSIAKYLPKIPYGFLDACHNVDFRNNQYAGKIFRRGGLSYECPSGSYRYALKVSDMYGDNKWLGKDKNAWAVAYHATSLKNALSIVENGFDFSRCKRNK
uniref:Uncharacterized protein n=1 Tax=Panagrolaimus sp. PS1159 TaxID=55785 RepID=A0AC35G411_9BILA